MDNLLPALAMERCSEKTKLTSYWRILMIDGVLRGVFSRKEDVFLFKITFLSYRISYYYKRKLVQSTYLRTNLPVLSV